MCFDFVPYMKGAHKMSGKIHCYLLRFICSGCLVLWFLCAGCQSNGNSEIISVSGAAYSSKRPTSVVTYSLPQNGNQESLLRSKYYIEIEVRNSLNRSVDAQAFNAYFYGKSGSILEILVLNMIEPIKPGQSALFHLDADGYTQYLLTEQESTIKLCVSFDQDINFVSDLPTLADLGTRESMPLTWIKVQCIPDLTKARPTKINEWNSFDPLGTPAIMRKQDAETVIYFYYPLPKILPVKLSSERFGGIKRTGELFDDLAPLGISDRTTFTQVRLTP